MAKELQPVGRQGNAKVLRETGPGQVAEEMAITPTDASVFELILAQLIAIRELLTLIVDD